MPKFFAVVSDDSFNLTLGVFSRSKGAGDLALALSPTRLGSSEKLYTGGRLVLDTPQRLSLTTDDEAD